MASQDFLGGDLITSDDPLAQLHALLNAGPDQASRTSAVQRPIPNVPTPKLPGKQVLPPGPMTHVANGGQPDWAALLENLAPLLGSFAMQPSQQSGFLEGWMHGGALARDEKQKRESATQARNQAAANFKLEVGQHALGIDDPVQRSQFIDLAESSGTTAGLLKAGDLASLRDVPPSQAAQARLKELVDQLTSLDKGGYNLDDLSQSGATIKLKDGSSVPVKTAIDLTRARPYSAQGQPVAKPAKVGNTEEERAVERWAKDHGKTVDTLTFDEEMQARTAFRGAGRVDPQAGPEAQLKSLVSLWKSSHAGQDVPENVMTQLRKQANEVNDRPPTLGGMNSLYADIDPKAIAQAIRNGTHPPDIVQYGRPAGAAISSELAKGGPNGEKPFNLSSAQREWKAQLNLNRTMNGSQQVRLDESIRSGLAMYDKIDQLAEQWNGLGLGILSRANLAAARDGAKGQKAASLANQLTGQIAQLTSDVATIEQGGLTPTSEARAVAEQSLQAWWGKGTILDMTAQGRYNMQVRHLARETQQPMIPGNGVNTAPALPATPAGVTPKSSGGMPTYQDYLRSRGRK